MESKAFHYKVRSTNPPSSCLMLADFKNVEEENRSCELYKLGEAENESHFLLYCPFYDKLRIPKINEMSVQNSEMLWRADDDRMESLTHEIIAKTVFLFKLKCLLAQKNQDHFYIRYFVYIIFDVLGIYENSQSF